MNKLGEVVIKYCEGTLTKDEMDEKLARYGIRGEVKERVFTGYDYENQVWLKVFLGGIGGSYEGLISHH
jgi:hypothetical protein